MPVVPRDLEAQPSPPLHGLHAVEGHVPQDLGHEVRVVRHRRQRGFDAHVEIDPAGPGAVVPDQPGHVLHDGLDVSLDQPRRARAGEQEEVGEDPVQAPGLRLDGGQGGRALVRGQRLLRGEQGGGVDDGGQGVPDLVGDARRQLPGRGQPLRLGEARPQTLPLGDVSHELEEEHLTVGPAHRSTAEGEAPLAWPGDLHVLGPRPAEPAGPAGTPDTAARRHSRAEQRRPTTAPTRACIHRLAWRTRKSPSTS